jgi:beta-phosphoglucomutase-like phosphatase (HAD superfamily)
MLNWILNVRSVIFDWDGTLADTRQVVVASFQKALSDVRCEISGEFIERRIGIGSAQTFREILRSSKMRFDEMLIKSLVEKKIQNEIEMSGDVKLFDGSLDFLESVGLTYVSIDLTSGNVKVP